MAETEKLLLTAGKRDAGERVDVWLNAAEPSLSRSYVQKLIRSGAVLVNGKAVRNSLRVQEGDRAEIILPETEETEILPENIPLDIRYEDDELLVVNKPRGMVVHPAAGHAEHTLVNALLYHCRGSLSGINGVLRPGIVHRIDRDTTGLLVVCKTDRAHRSLAEQLSEHSITRRYRALVHGTFRGEASDFHILPAERSLLSGAWENSGTSIFRVEGCIGRHSLDRKKMTITDAAHGKTAVTHVHVLQSSEGLTFVECRLETGRTHQIRVHLSHLGHPILGDPVYGPKKCPVPGLEGQVLHAMVLGFHHPVSGEYLEFSAELPDFFSELLKKYRFSAENVV